MRVYAEPRMLCLKGASQSVPGLEETQIMAARRDAGRAFDYLYNEVLHSAAEARAYWGQSTIGKKLPSSVHLKDHAAYNNAVRTELATWATENRIDLATMSADDARAFSLRVQSSQNPDIARIVNRIHHYQRLPSPSKALVRGLTVVGAAEWAERFYPSPMRAPQCYYDPNIPGC